MLKLCDNSFNRESLGMYELTNYSASKLAYMTVVNNLIDCQALVQFSIPTVFALDFHNILSGESKHSSGWWNVPFSGELCLLKWDFFLSYSLSLLIHITNIGYSNHGYTIVLLVRGKNAYIHFYTLFLPFAVRYRRGIHSQRILFAGYTDLTVWNPPFSH